MEYFGNLRTRSGTQACCSNSIIHSDQKASNSESLSLFLVDWAFWVICDDPISLYFALKFRILVIFNCELAVLWCNWRPLSVLRVMSFWKILLILWELEMTRITEISCSNPSFLDYPKASLINLPSAVMCQFRPSFHLVSLFSDRW